MSLAPPKDPQAVLNKMLARMLPAPARTETKEKTEAQLIAQAPWWRYTSYVFRKWLKDNDLLTYVGIMEGLESGAIHWKHSKGLGPDGYYNLCVWFGAEVPPGNKRKRKRYKS